MPTTMHVIRADEFVRLDPQGKLDLAESRRILGKLAATLVKRNVSHAVVDVRHAVTAALSVTDMYELASTFENAGFERSHCLAVVYPPGPGDKSQFFALCASNRGWRVAAFPDWGQAIDWLFGAENLALETDACRPGTPPGEQGHEPERRH